MFPCRLRPHDPNSTPSSNAKKPQKKVHISLVEAACGSGFRHQENSKCASYLTLVRERPNNSGPACLPRGTRASLFSHWCIFCSAEKFAEENEARMRGALYRFHRYRVHGVTGFTPHPPFREDRHAMPGGHREVSNQGSSEVSGSVGFVVRGLGSVHLRNEQGETNEQQLQADNRPTEMLHGTPSAHTKYAPQSDLSM